MPRLEATIGSPVVTRTSQTSQPQTDSTQKDSKQCIDDGDVTTEHCGKPLGAATSSSSTLTAMSRDVSHVPSETSRHSSTNMSDFEDIVVGGCELEQELMTSGQQSLAFESVGEIQRLTEPSTRPASKSAGDILPTTAMHSGAARSVSEVRPTSKSVGALHDAAASDDACHHSDVRAKHASQPLTLDDSFGHDSDRDSGDHD